MMIVRWHLRYFLASALISIIAAHIIHYIYCKDKINRHLEQDDKKNEHTMKGKASMYVISI